MGHILKMAFFWDVVPCSWLATDVSEEFTASIIMVNLIILFIFVILAITDPPLLFARIGTLGRFLVELICK
jgi:hypothetical protein